MKRIKNMTPFKIWILCLAGIAISQSLFAANILKIATYSVEPSTEFIIQIVAENSSPFVAFQADIPLPAGFKYVEGSALLNASRISSHALSASLLTGNILRLIGYSINNTAFTGTSGALVSFKLKSGTNPATYALAIQNPLLGDSQSNNILTSSVNGAVTVLAPNIKLSAIDLNYGRVPLGTNVTQTIQITNEGNRNLIVSSLTFNDAQFTTTEATPITIGPNNMRSVAVKFTPSAKGTFAKQIQISCNDPDQPSTTIAINAIAFAVNEIHTGNLTGASSSSGKLDFSINNMEGFTGFQFDINLPQPMTYSGTAQLFRSVDHTVSVSQLNVQTLRVLVFSAGNKNFIGTAGKVLSLDFTLKGVAGGYSMGISNVIIANSLGENIVSASYGGYLQITSPDIDAPTQLNFGDVSILSSSTKLLRINNYGQEAMTITQLMFNSDYFKSNQTLPVTIQPYTYLDLPVEFIKSVKGAGTGTLKIISNDPDENPFTIQLSGIAFAPNYLLINAQSIMQGESKNVAIEVDNEEPFVALQFDLTYPAGFTPDLNAVALTDRKQDHGLSIVALSATSLRILVYSMGQKTFTGKTGPILNIPFKAETNMSPGAYNLTFSKTLMSNIKSENILYASRNGSLTVLKLNHAPIANAGADQTVNEGLKVTLDGSASSDVDGNPLMYQWTAPLGISLSSTTVAKPTFTSPEVLSNTNYTFSLVINDGTVNSTADQVFVTVKQVNKAPNANAGADQSINEGSIITLDGSGSSDADGNPMTYKWTAPPGVTLSSLTIAKPTFTAPEVLITTNFNLSLVVNDGTVNSTIDQIVVTVKQVNKSPIANAGVDQSVNEGVLATLDGSASTDADNNTLTYLWTAPLGVTLSSLTVAKPTFTAPEVLVNTDFTFSLVVNDGTVNSTVDQVIVTVKQVNKAPVANAGPDKSVMVNNLFTLDGSISSDPDNDAITFKWTAPAGIILSSTTVAKPTFTAPEIGINTNYSFTLVVNDGTLDSQADQVIITIKQENKVPIANAGADQTINEGVTATLDGTVSSDPDNDVLTYLWTAPAGITLSSTTVAKPTFTAPEVLANTDYTFSLVINDGTVNSTAVQIVVTIKQVNKPPFANAGANQLVNEGVLVFLDASASTDQENNALTYLWTAPIGVAMSSPTAANPTFIAPKVKNDSVLTFTLIVNNGVENSLPSEVKVSVKNIITKLEVLWINKLKVFPNPTNGILNIEGLQANVENKISIYSIGGSLIKKKVSNSQIENIDISDQIPGAYLLIINEKAFNILKK